MTARRIFDAHVHVEAGLDEYTLPVVGKNVIFNEVASYKRLAESYHLGQDTVTLILDMDTDLDFIRREAAEGRIDALKIHSRSCKISESDWENIAHRLARLPPTLPVVIDTFYYGGELQFQPNLGKIIDIISRFPERAFVIAHSGGYRVLEYFFHLREFKNCYYELALSLQYFEDSSVMKDIQKLITFTDKSKVLYGSDFPYAEPQRQYSRLLEICSTLNLAEPDVDRISYLNGWQLFTHHGSRMRG